MHITLVGLNARYTHSCLALFYLRNELQQNGKDVEIDINQFTINDPYYELLLNLSATAADYYFFSAAVWNSSLVSSLIDDLLQVCPETYCIVGGPQAEIVAGKVSQSRCSAVLGEIERVGSKFYQDLASGDLLPRYIGAEKRKGFSAPYIESDFADHLQNRHIYFESSRGCPYSCTYCLSAAQKGVYHKPIEQLKEELSLILSWNPAVVRFVDRTFNDSPQRALAVWQFLAEWQGETCFHFEMGPDRFTEEMFEFLAGLPVGKFQFEIGIQSTHPETLGAIRRPVDTEVAGNAIRRLKQMENIHLHVDLILGLPYETKHSFLTSFKDVFAMNPHYIQMGLLKILPDTPMCHTAPEYGYNYSAKPPYPVLENRWLDHHRMQELYWFGECVERFVNNRYFVSLWEYLRKNNIDCVAFFTGILGVCKTTNFFRRAATQEFLCNTLLLSTKEREDHDYIVELIRYDWLRCGHRYFPKELEVDEEHSSGVVKKMLYSHLRTEALSGEDDAEIVYALKKGFFLEFSHRFMEEHGYGSTGSRYFLSFLQERDASLHHYCKVIPFCMT